MSDEVKGRRFGMDKDPDAPFEQLKALSEAMIAKGNSLTLVIYTTPVGHGIYTTKHVEENLVRHPVVGNELVSVLRDYANSLEEMIAAGETLPIEEDDKISEVRKLMAAFLKQKGCDHA